MRSLSWMPMARFCCIPLIIGLVSASADEPLTDSLTAKQVLNQMAKVYAGCTSYRDKGVVTTVFVRTAVDRTVIKPFQTAFVRPDRFRFEYTDKEYGREHSYIVWQHGKLVQTSWNVQPGIEKHESLGRALAGATGVSGGSAHTIPALLLPREVGGRRLTGMSELKRGEDVTINKVDCFRIEGMYADSPRTIWIDKRTFLVRQIEEQIKFKDFRTEETTTYSPAVGEEIPDKMLEFDPP